MGLFIGNCKVEMLNKVKETEKAVAVRGWANYEGSKKTFAIDIWIPKSIIKGGEIAMWFINKKSEEFDNNDLEVVAELA